MRRIEGAHRPVTPITCLHMNHLNAVVDGFDDSVGHFRDVYGAQLLLDMPREEWHACLIAIGGVIFELFAPHDDLLHARFGPHYIGVEYQTPDVERARQAVGSRGIRIVRELGAAFHVHPLDAFGVAFEFFDRNFHDVPSPVQYLEPIRLIEHPLGLTGLERYSVAVSDLDTARDFFQEFVDGQVAYEEDRPAVGAWAVGVRLGDTVVELLSPVGAGPIESHIARHGDGIRSVVFKVRDLEQARTHFAGRGVELQPGDADGTLAISPSANRGLLFEFAEVA